MEWAHRDPKGFVDSLGSKGVIDEIQRVPRLTVAVKYAIDNQQCRFVMTGSSSLGLLDAAADSLAGRIDIVSLPTACWGEDESKPVHGLFEEVSLQRIIAGNRRLPEAVELGQFPEVLSAVGKKEAHRILERYKSTYFTMDLMQMANLENARGLLSILYNVARSIGSHLEVSHFAREAGVSHATAKKYLATLEASGLTFSLGAYHYGPAKRYAKSSKVYFSDNGIGTSLGRVASEGQLFENFVIAELEKRRMLGFIRCDQLCYYKSTGGAEIDVVFEHDGLLHAVEIKRTKRPSRGHSRNIRAFKEAMKRPVRAILIHGGDEQTTQDGVELVPVANLYGAGGL